MARRADIVLVAGGVYASEPRPAVIVQDDLFDALDSVTVCPLTTTRTDAPLLRLMIPASEGAGIETSSYAMVDKLTTVRRSNCSKSIGHLDSVQMMELERRILVFLGFAR